MSRRSFLAGLIALNASVVLTGCGFRMRGSQQAESGKRLPFTSLHVGAPPESTLGSALRRQLAFGASLTETLTEADARLEILRNQFERDIVSLTGGGRVREYQISQTVLFRLIDRNGDELIPTTRLRAQREYSFNDSEVIAHEREEALLIRHMEEDLANQIVRRLNTLAR